jgi:hypothetical protein
LLNLPFWSLLPVFRSVSLVVRSPQKKLRKLLLKKQLLPKLWPLKSLPLKVKPLLLKPLKVKLLLKALLLPKVKLLLKALKLLPNNSEFSAASLRTELNKARNHHRVRALFLCR